VCCGVASCPSGKACNAAGLCVGKLGAGCGMDAECGSGFCTDGVCCGVASCPSGKACNAAGLCVGKLGAGCGMDAECGSGFCVDGVCCGAACDGQCEACDVPGSEGACTPVVGKPRSGRTACASDPANPCAERACDGASRGACAGYASGATVVCRAAGCTDGAQQPEARCDGTGACAAPATRACAPYACGDGACKTSCTTSADCAAGASCSGAGTCVTGATCGDEHTLHTTDGTTVDCAPYDCRSGTCLAACAPGRDADCNTGFVCSKDGACVDANATGATAAEGGCATTVGRPGSAVTAALAAIALMGFGARRRWARARAARK
jgi:hypothetical protein